jgi:hypothetical protein
VFTITHVVTKLHVITFHIPLSDLFVVHPHHPHHQPHPPHHPHHQPQFLFHKAFIVIFSAGILLGISLFHQLNVYPAFVGFEGLMISKL